MPDSLGRMSDAEFKAVTDTINEKWKGSRLCPVSNDTNWFVQDSLVVYANYTGTTGVFSGTAFPQILVVCATCGYTMPFNANQFGLFAQGRSDSWVSNETNRLAPLHSRIDQRRRSPRNASVKSL